MNRFARDMLTSRYPMQDGRNPYGSRGGYVTTRRPQRRDRDMQDYGEDYARGQGGRGGRGGRRDYGYDYDMRGDMRGGSYDDYRGGDYGGEDYRYRDYGDYGYDDRRDYGHQPQYGKLSHKDMEEWKKALMNADGSHGEKFQKHQIEQIVKQHGINVDSMGGIDVFALAVNVMYSDYCEIAKKFGVDRPEFYVMLAKAFLEDKDSTSKGEEKLWLYYKIFGEQED